MSTLQYLILYTYSNKQGSCFNLEEIMYYSIWNRYIWFYFLRFHLSITMLQWWLIKTLGQYRLFYLGEKMSHISNNSNQLGWLFKYMQKKNFEVSDLYIHGKVGLVWPTILAHGKLAARKHGISRSRPIKV